MGFWRKHVCQECGLSGTVSGGDDFGFYVATQTRYCATCEALVDVETELWRKDQLHKLVSPDSLQAMLEAEKDFGKCEHCGTLAEIPWCFGQPCPRCGGEVETTGAPIAWD